MFEMGSVPEMHAECNGLHPKWANSLLVVACLVTLGALVRS